MPIDLGEGWPVWVLALAAYCLYLGITAVRELLRAVRAGAFKLSPTMTPRERGHVTGYGAGLALRIVVWVTGAVALVVGWTWMMPLLALGFVLPIRREFQEFARGMAEGRKSAQLASAIEYVHGRVAPAAADYFAAAGFVTLRRVLPLLGVLLVATGRT